MRLKTALNEYKGESGRFPDESKTIEGSFSGYEDRLVHVQPDGSIRDYSSPLSGLYGLDRSRLGIETAEGVQWFDDLETIRQHYYRDTRLVETEYDAGAYTVHQYDLTLGRAHVTHVELRGAVPEAASLVAFLTLAPEGKEGGVGALIHDDGGPDGTRALEVYHRREHDYLAASTGLESIKGQRPEQFEEILGDEPVSFPRGTATQAYDQTRLSGDFLVSAPLKRAGRSNRTTLVSQLSDHAEINRGTALADLRNCAREHASADALREAARDRTFVTVPQETPRSSLVRTDMRVLDLLEAKDGGHIAAPEFDTFFANSGGYGYVWFRDDAEIAHRLLAAGDRLQMDVLDALQRSARFQCRQQLPDGTWPHRVWASDGSLAPGWANANVEHNDESLEYQADQTASVTAFLATLLRERQGDLEDDVTVSIRETIVEAVDALVRDIDDNGLPSPCQTLWEDATGQSLHTAATYIEALSSVARAPIRKPIRERALSGAEAVLSGLSTLWDDEMGAYVMRLDDAEPDRRLDSAGLALVEAVDAYDHVEGTILGEELVDRLETHVETTIGTLYRDPDGSPVAGLARYEGDQWRRDDQGHEKIWSVSTSWGAVAAAKLAVLLDAHDRDGDRFLDQAAELYELLDEDGALTTEAGYLAEQVFDNGDLDSAAPLGWAHALRLHTTALLDDQAALPARTAIEGPDEQPTWTTGEKLGLVTAADHDTADPSRVWSTLTRGALTEVRFPRVDLMNVRTLDFLVRSADGEYTIRTHKEDRRSEDTLERRVEPIDDESLRFRHVFEEGGNGQGHTWELTVEYVTDPSHDALVADVSFEATDDTEYEIYAVTDVALTNTAVADRGIRLGNRGDHHLVARDPTGYTGETDGTLLADADGEAYSVAIAMAAASRFEWATVATAGSEELRALYRDGELPPARETVDGENVVLVGRLGTGTRTAGTIALGFARHADTAAALGEATGALERGFGTVGTAYDDTWRTFVADKPLPGAVADDETLAAQYRTSLMSLYAVEDKTFHGASIASPSVPWGEAVPADEPKGYGYNFVWSRDLYQVFTVFEAVGALDIAQAQLEYIYEYQQDERGFIPQNTYVDGRTRWGGEQMDNISFPQVMAYQLANQGIGFADTDYDYVNVARSADYVARNGPDSAQERWEEESGYSPSSIAAEIAGLTCASQLAAETDHDADALVWQAVADEWARSVDSWTATTTGTDRHTTTPYYVRVTADGDPDAGYLRTLANDGPTLDERDVLDAGFLELVRLGITPADDPVIGNSLVEVDDTIRVDVGEAAGFYRYNGDGYGERERGDKGAPWSVEHSGKGRLWPLLTGERGEFELHTETDLGAAGCLRAMATFANEGRMIAEQVWDRDVETDYGWEFGEGTGSATPLAWAMAQYVRLAHGIDAGKPVETPEVVADRFRERGLHDAERPDLRVETTFRGNSIEVFGETDGQVVAVKSPVDSTRIRVEDGTFEGTLDVDHGESRLIVAAASDDSLSDATTAVRRLRI
ncbi:Glucoamylase, glycosyl hydrolase family 15 [Halorhabdus sp. SVX81]|uniref:glycoside hydrolase family 15 protein n=1 Tax=Halorhabdus sp. SVX81 TaxID=2978283 RepID=UPI0023D98085|nr:glycoside hydrolase family 15 protein [Halorhabdus sp. SVX81]WEL16736.1 Glucoamylase, glycosyl hydrolase family 15 [Halorhabdus sp. SVX81]